MNRYHVIEGATGYRVDTIIWDGESDLILPEGQFAQLDDGSPVPAPPEPQAPTPTTVPELLAYAKAARNAAEVGGITVSGVPIDTDERSQRLVAGARDLAEDDPEFVAPWSAADGHIYPLPAAVVIAMSKAVGLYVNSCFAAYAVASSAISAGTMTTPAEIDAHFAAIEVAF